MDEYIPAPLRQPKKQDAARSQFEEPDTAPSPVIVVWVVFASGLTLGAIVASFVWRMM